ERETGELQLNQLRHYYDVDCLLKILRVQKFIGTDAYFAHKKERFRSQDEPDLTKNDAFLLEDGEIKNKYVEGFNKISSLFYGKKPNLESILKNLNPWLTKL